MANFSDYLDQYPGVLPGDIRKPPAFKSTDRGSFFERFLQLQANPQSLFMQKINLPERMKQFMAMGGIQ